MRMMRVTIRFLGDLIPLLGREQTLEMEEGARVKALVRLLSSRAGASQPGYIGRYRVGGGELSILVNGRNIDTLDGVETALRDGDVIIFLPLSAGG